MRVGLQSWGTEGDLRPFLGLGRALRRRGHDVELVFTGVEGKDFGALADAAGVPTRFVDDGYFMANRAALARKARASLGLGGPRKQFELILRDLMDPVEGAMLAAARELAAGSDVVVGHFLSHPTPAAAEERRRPFVMIALQPVFGSRHYPPAGTPALGPLNPVLWRLANGVMRQALLARSNRMRAACGLAPERRFRPADFGRPRHVLVAVSPALFPRPSDWASHVDVCGFLGLEEARAPWEPEPDVADFLADEPPVFLSFGSMFGFDDGQTMEAIAVFVAALAMVDARGVIQAPAHVIARAPRPPHVCYVERAPHAALFPRCSAIVHHGGAGTTQSALLAGRGSVVVPHAADQFLWADLLYARGVGVRPLTRPKLAVRPLAARLLDDATIAPRAMALAAALRADCGPQRAVAAIEHAAS